jgi:5-oxopent-3-ene-1,2,5-tricarboxylate decarboxylase/2-hydroxyhepta-2,4-diene-1,7-dioate isomerase
MLSGRVYGTLLSQRAAFDALKPTMSQAPYSGAPKAPVLYIKPRNTLARNGDAVAVPAGVEELEVNACLGVVIGQPACDVPEERAMGVIAGYVIVNDVSVPHADYYRPAIRHKCRDGFCPIGPAVVPGAAVGNPNALNVRVIVDDRLQSSATTADLVQPIEQILSDVTEFMTLSPGDVLAVGVAFPAPRVRAGQRVRIEIGKVGSLENPFVAEGTRT